MSTLQQQTFIIDWIDSMAQIWIKYFQSNPYLTIALTLIVILFVMIIMFVWFYYCCQLFHLCFNVIIDQIQNSKENFPEISPTTKRIPTNVMWMIPINDDNQDDEELSTIKHYSSFKTSFRTSAPKTQHDRRHLFSSSSLDYTPAATIDFQQQQQKSPLGGVGHGRWQSSKQQLSNSLDFIRNMALKSKQTH